MLDEVSFLDSGGVGTTWVVKDTKSQKAFVVKLLSETQGRPITILLSEFGIRANINCRFLCKIERFSFLPGNRALIAMPYYEQGDLERYCTHNNRDKDYCEQIYRMIINISLALLDLHRNGIVHGDVKPKNILKSKTDWFLGDLGFSARIDVTGNVVSSAGTEFGCLSQVPHHIFLLGITDHH